MQTLTIGITVHCYQKDKARLIRALESIYNQTYQNYFVCLIGDKYEDNNEFLEIAKTIIPQDKIYFQNLPFAAERDVYPLGSSQLWCAGGVNAINYAIDTLKDFGYKYIASLDHDDVWLPNHLQNIVDCIKLTNPDFICTKAVHFDNRILPDISTGNKYIQFQPVGGDCIHSSICINAKTLNHVRYRDLFHLQGICEPSDADYLRQIANTPNIISVCIDDVSCVHSTEGI